MVCICNGESVKIIRVRVCDSSSLMLSKVNRLISQNLCYRFMIEVKHCDPLPFNHHWDEVNVWCIQLSVPKNDPWNLP